MRFFAVVIGIVVCATAQAAAIAQEFSLPPLIGDVGMGNIAIGHAAMGSVERSTESKTSGAISTAHDLSYRSDPTRTSQNLQNFVSRTTDPLTRANLQSMFDAQPGIIGEIRAALEPFGIDTENLADVYAYWWISSWLVANQRSEDPDRSTIDGVKAQAHAALVESPEIVSARDSERQEFAEAMLLQGLLLSASFEQWQGDPTLLQQLAQAAEQGALATGLNLKAMNLTSAGFELR